MVTIMIFHFACPEILIFLPLPCFIYLMKPLEKTQTDSPLKVPFYAELHDFLERKTSCKNTLTWRQGLAILIWILLVIAASAPQYLGEPISTSQLGRNIILAVDISGSMQAPDASQENLTRLDAVKQVADAFIANRVGDRIGLVLFGTHAYLQVPLTFDRKTVQTLLDDATVGLAGPQTAIGDALGLSIKRLTQQKQAKSRIVILLTDGVANAGSIAPLDAAKQAAQLGIKVYTVGLGSEPEALPGLFALQSMNASAALDEKTLKAIAHVTGGEYFLAKDSQALERAYKAIDQLEPNESEKQTFRPITPLFRFPLGLALCLSLIMVYRYCDFKNIMRGWHV
jgi:Ca-activated chloride channel homolog